ncbi:MAG TPA: helix-turn-helix domain-containing protein [Candidatus Paceibacterota bacterium]|nr:helix-turn-helix domain-containing protein [Candidatus Paceibacterota bacterium]
MYRLMPTVAEQLRRAREVQNLTIYQLAEMTKIKTDHLRALESGNYDIFTAPVYIRGFVRITASMLKLNVAKIMGELDEELAQTEKFSAPPSLTGHSGGLIDIFMYQLSKVKWKVVLPLGGALLVFSIVWWGIRAWKENQAKDPLANLSPGVYQNPADSGVKDTLPLAPATPDGRR